MNRAGAETALMNWFRAFDRNDIQMDFLVHRLEPGDYDDEIRDLGGRIFHLPVYTGLNGLSYRKAVRFLLDEHPEWKVVHGHIGSCASLYLKEARKLGRITIAHSHNTRGPLTPSQLVFECLSVPTRMIADEFIGCSLQAGRDRFGSRIVNSPHYHTLPNGIFVRDYVNSVELHEAAKKQQGWQGRTVLGNVSRLTQQKNHMFLLEVFAEYLRRDPTALLVLVGEGDLRKQIEDKAQLLEISNSVVFYGLTDDVASVLRAFDVFVMPSLYEGLPVATVECQAAGIPMIISDGVPSEAMLTTAAVQVPLSASCEVWCGAISSSLERGNNYSHGPQQVVDAGFDVESSSAWLSTYYHRLAELV